MVKELDITDWEPFAIANRIEREISALLPDRKNRDYSDAYHTFSYQDDDDDDDDRPRHHFHSLSSCSSSVESIPSLFTRAEEMANGHYWLHGMSLVPLILCLITVVVVLSCQFT